MSIPATLAQREHWRSVRAVVLARDAHVCRDCGEKCSRGEADVHHLIPRAAGGADDPANLITLCDGCHAAHHPNLQGTLARRMIERWAFRLARALDHRNELAGVDVASRESALEAKLEAIEEMRRIATSTRACVRHSIVGYFGGVSSSRRSSLAVRILEWLFLRSVRAPRNRMCCDRCDRLKVDDADQVLGWASAVFAQKL